MKAITVVKTIRNVSLLPLAVLILIISVLAISSFFGKEIMTDAATFMSSFELVHYAVNPKVLKGSLIIAGICTAIIWFLSKYKIIIEKRY